MLCLRPVTRSGPSKVGLAGCVFLGIHPSPLVLVGASSECPSRLSGVCRVCGDPCLVPVVEIYYFSFFCIYLARRPSMLLIFSKSHLFVSLTFLLFFFSILLVSASVVAFFNFKISVMSFSDETVYVFVCQGCKSPDEFVNMFREPTFGPLGLCRDFVTFTDFCSHPLLPSLRFLRATSLFLP